MRTCKRMFLALSLLATMGLTSCSDDEKEVIGIEADYVELAPYDFVLGKGNTKQMTATILPEEAQSEKIVWSSADESIATVDETGVVTAVAPGTTRIRAAVGHEYGVSAVTVTALDINKSQVEGKIGDEFNLKVTVQADDAEKYERQIEWISSDESIALVDCEPSFDPAKAHITLLSEGKVTISAKSADMVVECEINVNGFEPAPGIGDFLYSDGTRSSELDPNKTPVGIVFWLGNPTTSDMALLNDHPECTNGLAVAINGQQLLPYILDADTYDLYTEANNGYTLSEWMDAYIADNGITDFETIFDFGYPFPIKGYNNTKAMEAFNNAPSNSQWPLLPIQALQEYRKATPTPEGTSGWYIPSLQELSLLCIGEYDNDITDNFPMLAVLSGCAKYINTKLVQVEGADLLVQDGGAGTSMYWTSTEMYSDLASSRILHRINMSRGNSGTDMPYNRSYVRYILAF